MLLQSVCPSKLVFMLKDGEVWRGSNENSDFTALLKPDGRAGATGKIDRAKGGEGSVVPGL